MQRVTIIGLGLVGGSIGLGLRRWSEANRSDGQSALEVTGFDTNLDHQSHAQRLKAIDKAAWDLPRAVSTADLVVVATPVVAMAETFQSIAPHLKQGAVVTDVGSTKAQVLRWAQEFLPRSSNFVGGHPMAGKTESIEGADADLFKGATWCITPSVTADEEAVRTVLGLVAALGAEPYFVDPAEHDGYVAGVSHLPFVLAASLMNAVSGDASWRDMKTLTASGFRDVSRLASGSPDMHRDILLTNREAVTRWIDALSIQLAAVRSALATEPDNAADTLTTFFTEARDARASWAVQTTREGELVQATGGELQPEKFGDHVGRMFLGGLARKRKAPGAPQNPDNGTPR